MYLFSNVRYFLEGEEIEYFENAGITTTIHNYLTKSRNYRGGSWFWVHHRATAAANATSESWRIRNVFINPKVDAGVWYGDGNKQIIKVFTYN